MLASRASKQIIWFVPAVTGVLTFIWALERELGVTNNGWLMLAMSFIIALLLVAAIYAFLHYSNWRFADFLKIADQQPLILVVGAYKDIRLWAQEKSQDEKERYFKMKNSKKFLLEGAHGYLTGLDTTLMISQFVYRLRDLTDRKILIVKDDQPPTEGGPLVCFGSPRSNFQSEVFLPDFIQFTADSLNVTIHSTPMKYARDETKDYGIVARHKVGDRWAFICAGIDEEGTIGSGFYLLDNWKVLHKYKGSFVHIISCKKDAPESPQRFLGFSPGAQGEWVADSKS